MLARLCSIEPDVGVSGFGDVGAGTRGVVCGVGGIDHCGGKVFRVCKERVEADARISYRHHESEG